MALAIDIETMERLHVVPLPPITCICMYDAAEDKKYQLKFWKIPDDEREKNKSLVLSLLDRSTCIIGYNVVMFDLEFIKRSFPDCVDDKRMSDWVLKTVDPFMFLKYIFKNTCKLDSLLVLNKLNSKSGSGSNAIVLAEEERWQELLDYCMDDTMLTYQLFSSHFIVCCDGDQHSNIQISPVVFLKWNNVLSTFNGEKFVSIHYDTCKNECASSDSEWKIDEMSHDAIQYLLNEYDE